MKVRSRLVAGAVIGAVLVMQSAPGRAAQPPAPPNEVRTGRAAAITDLSGYWVAFVTEDWRHRMVTPPKGDYAAVPLNPEGIRVADTWDWQRDQAQGMECKSYGAAGLMRVPTRLHITWQDDNTLKLETDAGTQERLFRFGAAAQAGERTWQGVSHAEWKDTRRPAATQQVLRVGEATPSYTLKVVTTGLRAGYLRSNGVPYSEETTLTEYFDTFTHTNGQEWLVVTSVVDDPRYLIQPYITTIHFKREADGSRWRPTPCEIVPPTRAERPLPPNGYLPGATMQMDTAILRRARGQE